MQSNQQQRIPYQKYTPVSYTHLDVYKRQTFGFAPPKRLFVVLALLAEFWAPKSPPVEVLLLLWPNKPVLVAPPETFPALFCPNGPADPVEPAFVKFEPNILVVK